MLVYRDSISKQTDSSMTEPVYCIWCYIPFYEEKLYKLKKEKKNLGHRKKGKQYETG